jgi:hypothetical protein
LRQSTCGYVSELTPARRTNRGGIPARPLRLSTNHENPGRLARCAWHVAAYALNVAAAIASDTTLGIKKLPGRLKRCNEFRASSASGARGGEATAIALEMPC